MEAKLKGQAPKRARGHARVAAIMQAGVDLFTDKGYEATTMTEIAARSETAIASLYRFFPTKEALAEALLHRYSEHVRDALAQLAVRAATTPPEAIADVFIEFAVALRSEHRFATVLTDGAGASDALRRQFRRMMRDGLAKAVRAAIPALPVARANAMAIATLATLKGLAALAGESAAIQRTLLREMRQMLSGYFVAAAAVAGAQT